MKIVKEFDPIVPTHHEDVPDLCISVMRRRTVWRARINIHVYTYILAAIANVIVTIGPEPYSGVRVRERYSSAKPLQI